jgi:hypothetical protein
VKGLQAASLAPGLKAVCLQGGILQSENNVAIMIVIL